MYKHTLSIAMLLALSSLTLGCNDSATKTESEHKKQPQAAADVVLKDHFSQYFTVGTAISRAQIMGEHPTDLEVVKTQFNAFTPENSMKWERIHPEPGVYDFSAADALVKFAEENKQQLVGHTLVWHSQAPDWVFEDEQGEPLSRDALLARMEEHINAVAGRYADKIYGWDVVNEALNEDGTLRQSKWLKIIGEDYIEQAFMMAKKAAPNARLYYNDYNLTNPEKRAGVVALVKRLQDKGIQIDGVGMQGHYSLAQPKRLADIEDSIIAYSQLGVDVMITELDVTVIPFPEGEALTADISLSVELEEIYNPYPNGLPLEVEQELGQRYRDIFNILKKHSDKISRVTFWGVSDSQSWRNNWPIEGRSDYPLVIDRDLNVKSFVKTL